MLTLTLIKVLVFMCLPSLFPLLVLFFLCLYSKCLSSCNSVVLDLGVSPGLDVSLVLDLGVCPGLDVSLVLDLGVSPGLDVSLVLYLGVSTGLDVSLVLDLGVSPSLDVSLEFFLIFDILLFDSLAVPAVSPSRSVSP